MFFEALKSYYAPLVTIMKELTLHEACESDLNTVLHMYRSMVGMTGCAWDEYYPNEENLKEDFTAGCLYILKEGGETVGAVSVVPENELDDLECWRISDGTQLEIARVVVAKEKQGNGYARIMLDRLLTILTERGCRSVHLLAAVDNIAAVKTYRALGFDFIGECDRYDHHYYICEKLLLRNI